MFMERAILELVDTRNGEGVQVCCGERGVEDHSGGYILAICKEICIE